MERYIYSNVVVKKCGAAYHENVGPLINVVMNRRESDPVEKDMLLLLLLLRSFLWFSSIQIELHYKPTATATASPPPVLKISAMAAASFTLLLKKKTNPFIYGRPVVLYFSFIILYKSPTANPKN